MKKNSTSNIDLTKNHKDELNLLKSALKPKEKELDLKLIYVYFSSILVNGTKLEI